MLLRLIGILWPLQIIIPVGSIVNSNQESANLVIYMQPPEELLPHQWKQGLECTINFGIIFFERYSSMTRALNLMFGVSSNLTSPTDYLQTAYLPVLHNHSLKMRNRRRTFRLTVLSDHGKNYDIEKTGNSIPNDFYVLIVDSIDKLVQLIKRLLRLDNWNPLGYFYVVYHNSLDYKYEREITHAISHAMRKYFVDHIGVLFARNEDNYVFLIHNYLNSRKCRSTDWQELGQCMKGEIKPETGVIKFNFRQFSYKYGKRNCTLRVCATVSEPFVVPECVFGLEIEILNQLKTQLKAKTTINCTKLSRGTLKKNGKWNGLLGELSKGHCDMVMGGFYPDNDVSNHFWVSQTYLEDSHTWFIKKADARPPWRALLSIFKTEVWICFNAVLFITWLAWYFFVNMLPEPTWHKELSLTAINALAVSICVTANERPLNYASRIFFYALSLYGLNFMAIYTSRLIVVFKDPGNMYQIQTLDEVINLNIPFGGPAENIDWFEDEPIIGDAYNDSKKFRLEYENLLSVAKGDRVILGGRMYMSQSNLSNLIYPFVGNVFSSPLQFFMTYGAPFQDDISLQILYCNDFGIVDKINKAFVYNNTYLRYISKQRPEFEKQAIVLTTEHFQGPFAVLIVGLSLSILTFLCELQYSCIIKRRQFMQNQRKDEHVYKKRKYYFRRNQELEKKREIKYGLIRKRKIKMDMSKPWFNSIN